MRLAYYEKRDLLIRILAAKADATMTELAQPQALRVFTNQPSSDPCISCLLTVYNGARFLREAIESILSQSYKDFELIIVDDGSLDDSWAIASDMALYDKRIHLVHQENAGISAALNRGLAMARGRYIARMDADDISLPDRFEFQSAYLDRHQSCVLVGGLAEGFLGTKSCGLTSGGRHTHTSLSAFPPKVAVAVHPMIMIRAEALRKIGGYRTLFPHAEDYDLFLRIAQHGSIDNPQKLLLRYRQHDDSISLRNLAQQERNAALAEVCAIHELQSKMELGSDADPGSIADDVWPPTLLEAYIAFRVWRRIDGAVKRPVGWNRSSIVAVLMNPRLETFRSRRYWGLRLRIIGYIGIRVAHEISSKVQSGRIRTFFNFFFKLDSP